MDARRRVNVRLVVIALLALALLAALIVATGGGFSGSGSPGSTAHSPVAEAPTPTPSSKTTSPSSQIQGEVTVNVRHVQAHSWQFTYTVHNTGTTPIGGLQINAPRSNLYHVFGRPGWSFFGGGVCRESYTGVLIYWSTGSSSPSVIAPKHVARFGFTVNTSGAVSVNYSLSWSSAHPAFGTTQGPAASSMPASAACGA